MILNLAKNRNYAHHFFITFFPCRHHRPAPGISAMITCTLHRLRHIENGARLQRRRVSNHRLSSLKTERNNTQAKHREHPKQRTSGKDFPWFNP